MARRNPTDAAINDIVSMALRQRRNRGLWITLALLILIGTAVWSHFHSPANPANWDGQNDVVCERVIDGDTIVINGPGINHEYLRLRGIDAPEIYHPGLPGFEKDAYFGPQARKYLTDRVAGQKIILKFDGTEKRDRYQRLLGYAYLSDSDCVNVDLVKDGYAYVDRRFKTMLESTLDQAEQQARARKVGLWAGVKESDMPAWRQKWLAKKKLSPDD